jgi:DNA-binding MarR family transcriptional regulator
MPASTRTATRKRNAPGSFELRESPGYLLRRCHQRSRQIFDELIGFETGLSRQQVALLIGIDRNPHATQARLSEATGFDRNTLAELMNRLIGKKLVERRRAETDARAYEVTLSELGANVVRNTYPKFRQVQARILAPLPVEMRPRFLECLHILSESLDAEEHKRSNSMSAPASSRHGKASRGARAR